MVEPTEDAAARALANVITAIDQAAQVMIGGPTPEREAIAAVLPELDALIATHADHCDAEPCPAYQTLTRIRHTLNEGTTDTNSEGGQDG